MDSCGNFKKPHEERKHSPLNQTEENYEIINLMMSMSQALKDADRIAKKICSGTNQYELEYDNNLYIGRSSVKSLVELKQTAVDVFANIKEYNGRGFNEKLNYDSLHKDLENSERAQARNQEFLKYLKLSLEGLQDIFSAKSKDGKCKFSDSETVSSTNRTDPSALGFSIFENSATNAATSSPLAT